VAKTREEVVMGILKLLQSRVPDVEAAGVVDIDGLPISMVVPSEVDEDVVAAMSAAILSNSERAIEELKRGNFEQVYISGTEGSILMNRCGKEALLTVVARPKAKLGLMFLDIKRAANEIVKIL